MAPWELGIALFRRWRWLAAAMGAFLPGPNAISAATAALDAAAILQPLSVPAAVLLTQTAGLAAAGARRQNSVIPT